MKHSPGRWLLYAIAFVIGLITLGTGPVGLALLIMIGFPLFAFFAFEAMAHSGGPESRL